MKKLKSFSLRNLTKKQKIKYEDIRESVMFVLSKNNIYKNVATNGELISSITSSVFKTMYKKSGNGYSIALNRKPDDFVSCILEKTKQQIDIEETKDLITATTKCVNNFHMECPGDSIKFKTIYATVEDKLDGETSKSLDFFESNFKNTVNNQVYAGADIDLKVMPARKDLLYLSMILVAEGVNKNKDEFLAEELESSYKTLIGMPLVEEHIPQAIKGIFYSASIVRIKKGKSPGTIKIVEKGGRVAILAKAYMYKKRFPREAYVLKTRQEEGLLRYSVEAGFEKAECSECGKQFKPKEQYCDHLVMRNLAGSPTTRIAKGVFFIGGAYTIDPAEKDAVGLEVVEFNEENINKTVKSCVNIIEGTSKDTEESKKASLGSSKSSGQPRLKTSGGKRMFEFDSVEELMGSDTVQALIDSKVLDALSDERDVMEASITEFDEYKTTNDEKIEALEQSNTKLTEKLEQATSELADVLASKKVSDVISNLVNNGYSFDSDEDLKAFEARIKDKSEEDVAFMVDLMKKTVLATSSDDKSEESNSEVKDGSEENLDEGTLKASQNADVHDSASNSDLASIRSSWDTSVRKLRGED